MGGPRGRVCDHELQFAARRTCQLLATLHRDARFSDTQFRELPRDGFAQSPSQLADGEGARHDQDAHAISLLDHLELAHLPVARHDSELEGMDHHLVPVPGREEQHIAGATFYGARADQGSSARAGLGVERDGVRHFQADDRLHQVVEARDQQARARFPGRHGQRVVHVLDERDILEEVYPLMVFALAPQSPSVVP